MHVLLELSEGRSVEIFLRRKVLKNKVTETMNHSETLQTKKKFSRTTVINFIPFKQHC